MEDLIKALQIFAKYGNHQYPTHCEHDCLYICGYDDIDFLEEDIAALDELGFFLSESEGWISYKYGSA